MAEDTTTHDLIVIGATAGGLSVAEAASRAGIQRVHIIDRGDSVLMPEVTSRNDLGIGYGEKVTLVDVDDDGVDGVASAVGACAASTTTCATRGKLRRRIVVSAACSRRDTACSRASASNAVTALTRGARTPRRRNDDERDTDKCASNSIV